MQQTAAAVTPHAEHAARLPAGAADAAAADADVRKVSYRKMKMEVTHYMKTLCLFLATMNCLLIGCAETRQTFVVLRDVPDSPSFCVVPANRYLNQTNFACRVEAAIIRSGARVVALPPPKEIVAEHQVGAKASKASSEMATYGSADIKLTEYYISYDELPCDYIVHTEEGASLIKIEKKSSKEVLTVFAATETGITFDAQIYDALEAIGVAVISREKAGFITPVADSMSTF